MKRLLEVDHSGPRAKDRRDSCASVPSQAEQAQLSDRAMVAQADSAEMVEALNRSSIAHFVAGLVLGLEHMAAPTEHCADALAARRTVADGRYH